MTTPTDTKTFEQMALALAANPDFKVLRRFDGQDLFCTDYPADAGIAIALDTETTGKTDADKIIELGLVSVAYDRTTGYIYGAVNRFNALEDPGMPIPPEASAVNHITDEMVAGQTIDQAAVQALVDKADFIFAHNAGFDRPFCERRFPLFAEKAWACTIHQVDWASHDIRGAKLDYIAYMQGFFYDAHRAEIDCLALVNCLRVPFKDGTTGFGQLVDTYYESSRRIWAVNSPFDSKDLLKARGYRWSDGLRGEAEKAWYIDVSEADFEAEMAFLKSDVYRGKPLTLPVDKVDAFSRFSSRRGSTERVYR